jgi:hypothetical protein
MSDRDEQAELEGDLDDWAECDQTEAVEREASVSLLRLYRYNNLV